MSSVLLPEKVLVTLENQITSSQKDFSLSLEQICLNPHV